MSSNTRRRDLVLVVDDSTDALGFLSKALERVEITPLLAANGVDALELLKDVTPDLVLLDAVMPGIDGFETCRRLKADRRISHIPVIFMTGLSESEHVIEGLRAGGVDYVTKPIIIDELVARVRVHLGNARLAHGARAALDVMGRSLLVTDELGRMLWCTLQAEAILFGTPPPHDMRQEELSLDLSECLAALIHGGVTQASTVASIGTARRLDIVYVSRMSAGEFLFRLSENNAGDDNRFLRQHLALSQRESEVLIWIARGKSNRDIGEILDISPRTVNKHLEQIFTKLGVENRASAAAQATRILLLRN